MLIEQCNDIYTLKAMYKAISREIEYLKECCNAANGILNRHILFDSDEEANNIEVQAIKLTLLYEKSQKENINLLKAIKEICEALPTTMEDTKEFNGILLDTIETIHEQVTKRINSTY